MPSAPPPERTSSAPPDSARAELPPVAWRTNLLLFLATIASVFGTAVLSDRAAQAAVEAAQKSDPPRAFAFAYAFLAPEAVKHGLQFAGALLTILVAHELGHFITARIHKVDASLPYFIPIPLLSPFGTMGAVIRMRGSIPTRAALLDIGASGPLAGLVFAIPMYFWGAAHSHLVPLSGVGQEGSIELGESIALRLLDRLAVSAPPDGMTLELHPVAFAAWAGMFVTMINLVPVGQLDGGHVAYALFGTRQDRFARVVHRAMLAFFFVSLGGYVLRDLRAGLGLYRMGQHVGNSLFWLVWFEMLAILGALGKRSSDRDGEHELDSRTRAFSLVGLIVLATYGREHWSPLLWIAWFAGLGLLLAMERRGGSLRPSSLLDHPPTGAAPLGKGRAAIAIFTLLLFALLFMPTPMSM